LVILPIPNCDSGKPRWSSGILFYKAFYRVCDKGKVVASHTLGVILIVDDEPAVVRGLARLLSRDGYL
jgi:hypothetical protein